MMSTYEVLTLLFLFGGFLIALIEIILLIIGKNWDNNSNNNKKETKKE